MMATVIAPSSLQPRLNLWDRLVALVAWAVAVAILAAVGWRALRPLDPEGAVGLLLSPQPVLMVVQVAVLSAVVAALVTLIVGRKLADAGVFAVCLGLGMANLRGATMASVLLHAGGADGGITGGLIGSLLLETVLWCGLVGLAAAVSGWTWAWYFRAEGTGEGFCALSTMMAADIPPLARKLGIERGTSADTDRRTCGYHLLTTVGIAFVLIGFLGGGTPVQPIRQGQVYFSIIAAYVLAGYVAHDRFPVRTAWWSWLAVPPVTLGAYLWAWGVGGKTAPDFPPSIPPSVYLRASPLEYVVLGTLGVMLAFWWTRQSPAQRHPRPSRPVRSRGRTKS